MSSIVTFYSYKGGVGRSMALANIAVLLARRGLKVLVVDWDLEAPGIERYFGFFEMTPGAPGLLRMFMEARDRGDANFRDFTCSFQCDALHPVVLLGSGRDQDEHYARNLEGFDWESFFKEHGGDFLERLRERWRAEFDIVLIDSRTGLSDTGGICTIQMPDVVVAMFTANYQSLFGVRDVMRLAQKARQGLGYDRMPLSVLPVPARWGVHEFQETQVWLDRIAEAMQECYADWLPRTIPARSVIESTKLPQADYFGFGEKLAVIEQGITDPQGLGFVYSKIASFLASNFTDLDALIPAQVIPQPVHPQAPPAGTAPNLPDHEGYLYDIFVSYEHSSRDSIVPILEQLRSELKLRNPRPLRIFVDFTELQGSSFMGQLHDALLRSRIMIAFTTPHSRIFSQPEFLTFYDRTRQTRKPLIALLVFRGGEDYWQSLQSYGLPIFDLRSLTMRTTYSRYTRMEDVAKFLIQMILNAPPQSPRWRVAKPAESEPNQGSNT